MDLLEKEIIPKHPETRGGIIQSPVKFLENFGGPAGTRTPNLNVRSVAPYPIGPQVRNYFI